MQTDQRGKRTAEPGAARLSTEPERAVADRRREGVLSREGRLAAEADALARLNELSSRLWRMRSLREGLDEMLAATIELLGADIGKVQLLDPDRGVLVLAAHKGFTQDFLDFFHEVSADDDSACGRALQSGERIVIEDVEVDEPYEPLRPIARSAGYRGVQSTPLIGRDGRPLGVLSTYFRAVHRPSEQELRYLDLYARQATDFIERWRSDEALRERESETHRLLSLNQAIMANMGEGMYAVDNNGFVTYMNPEAERLFGWKFEELAGGRMHDVTHYKHSDGSPFKLEECAGFEVLQSGTPLKDFEDWFIRKDGTFFPVSYSSSLLKDANGDAIGLVVVFQETTERKRAEQALRESQERYLRLIDALGVAVYTTDAQGVITYYNEAAVELWGRRPELGAERWSGAWRLHGPDGTPLPHEEAPIAIALRENREVRDVEVIAERPDGTRVWFQPYPTPLRNVDGEVIGAVNVLVEITKRKRSEEALRESEERFARFMQQLPGLAWIKDLEGRYLYANDAAEKAFRTPREKLYGRTDHDVFPAAVAARFSENDRRALASEAGVLVVETLEHEDGVVHHSIVSKFPIQGPDGRPVLIGGMAIDITERKQAEESLRESETRFRNMANSAPLMIWVTEPDASCSFLSKSWYEFTGQTPETALGFGWLDAIHPEDRVGMYRAAPVVSERREPFRSEYRVRGHNGEYRWMLDSAAPRFGTGGEFLGYIGSITDITERREMEEELRRANAAKDEFLGLVSHELRTPITTILGMSQVLRKRGESLSSEERQSGLDDIVNDAQRLDRIVRNLLSLARLEEGQGLELEPLLLGKMLSRLVEEHKRHFRRVVTLEIIGDVAAVTGHTDYLDQIVRNLLSNAEKYGGNGAIEVAVRQEGEFAVVYVSDRGRGIPEQEREAIFAPFFRSESTQTLQGIGIGLAVCRRLAEAMGGRIWVEPRKGGGSRFAFSLPVCREESP